jgi:hypothetical protein
MLTSPEQVAARGAAAPRREKKMDEEKDWEKRLLVR